MKQNSENGRGIATSTIIVEYLSDQLSVTDRTRTEKIRKYSGSNPRWLNRQPALTSSITHTKPNSQGVQMTTPLEVNDHGITLEISKGETGTFKMESPGTV
jgi:hypothetical protein